MCVCVWVCTCVCACVGVHVWVCMCGWVCIWVIGENDLEIAPCFYASYASYILLLLTCIDI